jgi:hypothetical protein
VDDLDFSCMVTFKLTMQHFERVEYCLFQNESENGEISSELVDERNQVATSIVRGWERANHIGMQDVTRAASSSN